MSGLSLNLDKKVNLKGLDLIKLEVLNISSTKDSALPSWIFELPHLKTLYLNMHNLYEVEDKIFNIESLENLTIKDSKVESIEIKREHKAKLKNLNLSKNKIKEIPTGLEYLTSLELLNLSKNPIEVCTFSFQKLSKLKFLYLDGVRFNLESELIKAHPSLVVFSNEI